MKIIDEWNLRLREITILKLFELKLQKELFLLVPEATKKEVEVAIRERLNILDAPRIELVRILRKSYPSLSLLELIDYSLSLAEQKRYRISPSKLTPLQKKIWRMFLVVGGWNNPIYILDEKGMPLVKNTRTLTLLTKKGFLDVWPQEGYCLYRAIY